VKKNILLLLIIGSTFFLGCRDWGLTGVRGNGKVVTENRNISDFTEIELGGAYNVEVKVGSSPSLVIYGEGNIVKYIRTRVEGDRLIIDTKKNISPRKEIKIKITVPSLNRLESSGACDIYAENISGDKFILDMSGAGSVEVNGKVDRLDVEISGAASLHAKNLRSKNAKVSLSGASSADVYASEFLDASVSGVGTINYYGTPKDVRSDVSGVGSISKK
jgi:hypothetical protein